MPEVEGGLVQLKVSYEDQPDGITVVRMESDGQGNATLDAGSAPELRRVLMQLIEDGRLILIVDLSTIDAVHGTGLGVLVGGLKRVHVKGGTLSLVVANDRLRAILSKTGLTKIFRIHDNVSSMVAALTAEYAEESIEQRRAARAERAARKRRRDAEKGTVVSGDHTYEHLSEAITLVNVMAGDVDELWREISGHTAPSLRKLLIDLVNQGRYFLVVDLTSVEFIDSTGLGVLVGGLKRIRAFGGAMALVVPSEGVAKAFRITGLTQVFPIFASVDRAVEWVGREVPQAHV